MSEKTKIEWATHSWNPWIGCTKVSPGCANCYAAVETFPRVQRHRGRELWGKGMARHRISETMWKQPLKWNRVANERPGGASLPVRPRVFPSMCDWLDDEVPIEWLADFLQLINHTPNLDWLLLTKRPENFHSRLLTAEKHFLKLFPNEERMRAFCILWNSNSPPANVWVGASVEDQKRADERIPELLKIPAKIRFLSVEPLLSQVSVVGPFECMQAFPLGRGIHWVIVGGESGTHARPCDVEWIRTVVRQGRAYECPVFVKQLGSNTVSYGITGPGQHWPESKVLFPKHDTGEGLWRHNLIHPKGGDPTEWPADLRVREFPEMKGQPV